MTFSEPCLSPVSGCKGNEGNARCQLLTQILCALALGLLPTAADAEEPPQPLWSVTECVGAPSHVLFDPASNRLLVSQISGAGDEKDGDGVILRMTLEGAVENCAWATGLNAPKGMARSGDSLWVSDIDELIEMNAQDGTILRRLQAEGARFLVGVTVASDGAVYAADLLTSSIFRVQGETCQRFAFGPDLDSPTGLLAKDKQLVIASWGLTDDFTAKAPGRMGLLDVEKQSYHALVEQRLGNLYGVGSDGAGGYLVTDWASGTLYHFAAGHEPRPVLKLPAGAAGLEYLPEQCVLIVAELKQDRVSAYEIELTRSE